jgi:hypothetical protein
VPRAIEASVVVGDSTRTLPPCDSATARTIESPRPNERPLSPAPRTVQFVAGALDDRVVGVDVQLVPVGHRAQLTCRLHEDVADVGRGARRLALGIGAGEQEEVGDEAAHAAAGAQRRLRGLPAVAVQ